jgi:lipopolysaccharide transport system ATP-binding protein
VSFEVKRGDRVGIIGRNGAGKSTLLKILSRITEPTTGRVQIKGRVASLLEVGTGFHPELTGRENIFLNGAILGMSKQEIRRKFDEIVAFADVEKFLDTPVKRYSSGMYVRLAFSIAAHLEPEILIVDEVLAVGDLGFQKKCIGKMEDVGKDGRTILFVSHNIGIIQQLCSTSIFLNQGVVKAIGEVDKVSNLYLTSMREESKPRSGYKRDGNGKILIENYFATDIEGDQRHEFFMGDTLLVNFSLLFVQMVNEPVMNVLIQNSLNEYFVHLINLDDDFNLSGDSVRPGKEVKLKVAIPNLFFTPGQYFISLWVGEDMRLACDYLPNCIPFQVLQGPRLRRLTPYPGNVKIFLPSKWSRAD